MSGQDTERPAGQQHSEPRSGRASVPMWDSSDPDRAPPPLPLSERQLNGRSSPIKANTSEHVAAAARALIERGRANWDGEYSRNASPEKSPERIIPKSTPQHKRLKSLQDAGMKDIRTTVELNSDRSSRASTPFSIREPTLSPPESPIRSTSATPTPTRARAPRSSIFGESSPISETLQTLRSMQTKDDFALGDVNNDSSPKRHITSGADCDLIHRKMQEISAIANHLQKEMAALSRRSKDNASDLLSLREATNSRDEDIRRTLRDLVSKVTSAYDTNLLGPPRVDASRSSSAMGFSQPSFAAPHFQKALQLPKSTPDRHEDSQTTADNGPIIEMLERVIKNMASKDGQGNLVLMLADLVAKLEKHDPSASVVKKLDEILEHLHDKSQNLALVPHKDLSTRNRSLSSESASADSDRVVVPYQQEEGAASAAAPPQEAPAMDAELRKILMRIKDSVTHGGGLMGEIKSLVRELRGEVLGMGRDLGRRLDSVHAPSDKALVPSVRDECQNIIRESLTDLQEQMNSLVELRRSESTASRNTVDTQEIFEAVKSQLMQQGLHPTQHRDSGLDRESILAAVREAYEDYKPEIELQQFGLERDEILQCLKEGLEDYQANRHTAQSPGISREEILETVQAALQDFQPPSAPVASMELRAEVVSAVRDCLQEYGEPGARDFKPSDMSREDIIGAVRDGMGEHDREGARVLELDQQGLLEAVQKGLEATHVPYGQQVIDHLNEIIGDMGKEFKEYSAANGRDTEQVLDAMKDGMESLRSEIETYVDRAQDVTGKDEILESLRSGFENLQDQLHAMYAGRSGSPESISSANNSNLLNYIKTEFESLHEAINSQDETRASTGARGLEPENREDDIVSAITKGIETLRMHKSMDEPSEELLDAFKAEFDSLRETILRDTAEHKDEILDSLQDTLKGLHQKMSGSEVGSSATYEIINAMREEVQSLRESMQAPVLHGGSNSAPTTAEIVGALQDTMEKVREQVSADQSGANQESLSLIREELENFRAAIGGSLMLSTGGGGDKDDIINAIKDHLDGMPQSRDAPTVDESQLSQVMDEINKLQESFANAVTPVSRNIDTGDFEETVRGHIDGLKSHFESQIVSADRGTGPTEEFFVGTLSDHLDQLKSDIGKMVDKPVDMTVSYEILETLKDGLNNLRTDIDQIRSQTDAVVVADKSKEPESATKLHKTDLERMEVMLAQLQIKVEAMDANVQSIPQAAEFARNTPDNVATRDDLAAMESLIRDIRASVDEFTTRDAPRSESDSTKETSEAIETILHNTKAKIDDHIIPNLQAAATREHLETVEALVKITHEAAEGLASKVSENTASKDDVASIAHLIDQLTESLADLKQRVPSEEGETFAAKSDVEAVGGACLELKDKLDEIAPEALPSKSDVEQVTAIVEEVRDSYNTFKARYEDDIAVTARAFDDRKEEASKTSEQLDTLKMLVDETREELKQRLKRSNADVRAIDEILESIETKVDEANTVDSVQEVCDLAKEEFAKITEALDTIRSEQGDQASSILEKAELHRDGVIASLAEKMESLLCEIKEKQEAAQNATEDATKAINEKAEDHQKILAESKAMAEELRVTIDTLGAAVTGIDPALKEATDKMTEDSQTVFNRVDELHSKLDNLNEMGGIKPEIAGIRGEFATTHSALADLRNEVSSQHPQYMEAFKSLLEIAEQHFEHSRRFQEMSETHHNATKQHFDEGIRGIPVPQLEAPPLGDKYDDTALHGKIEEMGTLLHSKLEEILTRDPSTTHDDSELRRNVEVLLSRELPPAFDDSKLHSKLDQVLENPAPQWDDSSLHQKMDEIKHLFQGQAQMDKLDLMHKQLESTADQVAAILDAQQKTIEGASGTRSLDVAPVVDISEQQRQKEALEAEVIELATTRDALQGNNASLRKDNENLLTQKLRLSSDVAALETALRLRREELHEIDERVKHIEHRVLDGVLNRQRALLMGKQSRSKPNMNLKRVTSNNSNASNVTTTPTMVNPASTAVPSVVSIALKPPTTNNMVQRSKTTGNPVSRRIASLNQITSNVPNGAKAYAAAPRAAPGGLMGLKRSQSVRNQALRKASWQPGALDKENGVLSEESEVDALADQDTNYSRSVSYTGTMTGTMSETGTYDDRSVSGDSEYTYGTGSEYTYGTGSEYTYGTGSYLSGSSADRRSSEGSVIHSTSGAVGLAPAIEESIHEDEEDYSDADSQDGVDSTVIQHEQPLLEGAEEEEEVEDKAKPSLPRLHTDGYDSGLGSDLPTADLSAANGSAQDYFRGPAGKPIPEEQEA